MIKNFIREQIVKAVQAAGVDAMPDLHLEHPVIRDNGDYSTNIALKLGKTLKKNPLDIAKTIVSRIQTDSAVKKVEIASPGFINFYLSDSALLGEINSILNAGTNYGKPVNNTPKKISVEHTQVNPNKEPHVGHLRNAVIGDSVAKLLEFAGNKISVLYYQNDIGQQIASIVLAYKKQWIKKTDFPSLIAWASKAYADVEQKMEQNPQIRSEKETLQLEISKTDTPDAALAKTITDEILKETLLVFKKLNIKYDCVVRESDIVSAKLWETTFELLKQNPNFYHVENGERTGCWVIKMTDSEDKIIVRSNGIPTYAGNDIAYHLWKFGILPDFKYQELDWQTQNKPLYTTGLKGESNDNFAGSDAIINIIDTTQTYPQQSVIESLKILGYANKAKNYYHVNYGFVYLSKNTAEKLGFSLDEDVNQVKISGRKGTVVSIENFLDKMGAVLVEKFGQFDTLTAVRNGAIKFELLKYNTYQDIVFDLDTALDVNGFSGPYIQYAYTRAQSVLKKSAMSPDEYTPENSPDLNREELELLRDIYKLEEVVNQSITELSPHYLCLYLFEVSKKFNAFYNNHRILGAQEEKRWLKLTAATAQVIKNGLNLIGIEAPEKM